MQYKLYSVPKNDVIGDSLSLGLPLLNLSDHDFFELTRFSDSWFPENDHFKRLVMMVFHFFLLITQSFNQNRLAAVHKTCQTTVWLSTKLYVVIGLWL